MTTGKVVRWPRERVDQLRSLWGRDGSEKLTAEQIGQQLGLSARAVIGKAHRLKLTPRRSPVTRYCGWIVEEVQQHRGRRRIRYCDAIALPGRPFCREHDVIPVPAEQQVNENDIFHRRRFLVPGDDMGEAGELVRTERGGKR